MPHHLQQVPSAPPVELDESAPPAPPDGPDPDDWGEGDDPTPRVRPSWWRWVAMVVVLAMIVATPFAYALYLWLN
jgi:hypothetical protein